MQRAMQRVAEQEGEMVNVTTRAKRALAMMRASAELSDPTIGLRLEAAADRFNLFPDYEKPGDQIVEHEGAKVLLIDGELTEALAGAKIDGKTTDEGLQIVIEKDREE